MILRERYNNFTNRGILISFGQSHKHEFYNKILDKDTILYLIGINYNDPAKNRIVYNMFKRYYSTIYPDTFLSDEGFMVFFPKGIVTYTYL